MSTVQLLFRQDPALRVLPRGIITSLLFGLLFRTEPDLARGLATLTADDLPGGFGPMYLAVMGLVLTFVLSGNAWTRASRISVGLPLRTRVTWCVRTASLVAVAAGTILSMAVVLGVSLNPIAFSLNPVVALAALRATVTSVLLVLVYQLPLAARDRIPITAEYVIYVIFMTIIILPFSASGITSIAGTAFFLGVTIALGAWLFIRTPGTWSVGPSVEESDTPVWSSKAPPEGGEATSTWAGEASPLPPRSGFFVHWTVFRGLSNLVPMWIILVGIAGAFAVVTLEFFDGANAFLPLLLVTVWHLPVLQMTLERMTPFDPVPISRRALWAHTFGPVVVAIVVGALVAQAVYRVNPDRWLPIHAEKCCVRLPWEYLEIAPNGAAPTVTAPWGESLTPATRTLWRGRLPALYDPYETTAESSPRFIEYQMRRAVTAIYGFTVRSDREPTDPGRSSRAADVGDLDAVILDLTRGHSADGRNRSAAVTLILFTLFGVLLVVPTLCQYGSSVHRKIFKWATWGLLILLGVTALAVAVARLTGYTEVWYVGALISIGVRRLSEWLPVPTGLLWVLCVTFWLGAYLLSGKIFTRIELPGRSAVNRFAEEY